MEQSCFPNKIAAVVPGFSWLPALVNKDTHAGIYGMKELSYRRPSPALPHPSPPTPSPGTGSQGGTRYLPQLPVVNQLRPMSVDQGTEAKAILPAAQGERR